MNLEISGRETPDQLLKLLAHVRLHASILLRFRAVIRTQVDEISLLAKQDDPQHEAFLHQSTLHAKEWLMERDFDLIRFGRFLVSLCPEFDKKVSREAIFDVINTSRADRTGELIDKYGDKASHILFVLDLENSATRDTGIHIKPLKWCHTMAFMNAMQTSEKLDRTVHDGANEFFGGVFGEYQERSVTERLTGVRA